MRDSNSDIFNNFAHETNNEDSKDEIEQQIRQLDEEKKKRMELINELAESSNFKMTHDIIFQMNNCRDWSSDEAERIYNVVLNNSQVLWIIKDDDVSSFMKRLIEISPASENSERVRAELRDTD